MFTVRQAERFDMLTTKLQSRMFSAITVQFDRHLIIYDDISYRWSSVFINNWCRMFTAYINSVLTVYISCHVCWEQRQLVPFTYRALGTDPYTGTVGMPFGDTCIPPRRRSAMCPPLHFYGRNDLQTRGITRKSSFPFCFPISRQVQQCSRTIASTAPCATERSAHLLALQCWKPKSFTFSTASLQQDTALKWEVGTRFVKSTRTISNSWEYTTMQRPPTDTEGSSTRREADLYVHDASVSRGSCLPGK